MNAIQSVLASEVAAKLNACRAKYLIILEDGTRIGDLEIAEEKKKKPRDRLQLVSPLYKDKLRKMKIGDVEVFKMDAVPRDKYPDLTHGRLSTCISAAMVHLYGKGGGKTYWNRAANQVEVLRIK